MEFALNTIRQDSTLLNSAFFSPENVNYIQKQLQERVYMETKRLIDRQNEDDLFIIMRAMYVISSTDPHDHISEQVKTLNEMTLSHVIPQVVFGLNAHTKFLQDIQSPAIPIERGSYVSMKGEKNNVLPVGM